MTFMPVADIDVRDLTQISLRWIHFLAGVIWIGHLYFFNFVNAQFAPKLDADTKRKVIPELLPRALYWFRWGAAFTWLTGFVMMFLLYYHGPYLLENAQPEWLTDSGLPKPKLWLPAFGGLVVGFLVYDLMFKQLKTPAARNVGTLVWGALAIGFGCVLDTYLHFSNRAIYVHLGALFGTAMAANVWMRIWPAQRRIITAIKNGQKPEDKDVALAGLRSRHNTYMSVPLLLFMVSVDQGTFLGIDPWQATVAVVLLVAFAATHGLYKLSTKVQGF